MFSVVYEGWRYRALVDALVRRHVATRYRGSVFGFLWSLMNPLCLMAIYTLVFQYYMRVDGGAHYHLMVFAGLLPWIWSSSALSEGTASLVSSGHLITKSIFPPHLLPLVSVASTMVHFVLALPVLALFVLGSGLSVPVTWLLLPAVVVLHGVLLFGIVLALSALNVFYRDVQHLVGNILTFLFFLCPVVYPVKLVPSEFRPLLYLNPFAVLTQMYQEILIEGVVPPGTAWGCLGASVLLAWCFGTLIHERFRERFAEAL